MRIGPVIAELRRDPAPQHRAQAALAAARDGWRTSPRVRALLEELGRYGRGAGFADCPLLARAFSEAALARKLVGSLVSAMARTLVEEPLGHAPFRHQYAQGLALLQLAEAEGAALSLVCYEARAGGDAEPAETVCFAGGERRELCLAGAADARFFAILREDLRRADLHCEARRILPGEALAFSGPRHTKIVDRPLGRMVLLRVSRGDAAPSPAREYRIADGALVHQASGDRAASRDEMAAAVLGAMQRADAAPVLATIARGGASDHLRWQALRQALALDTASGFAALTGIAADEADALAAPAGALRASLIERHPPLGARSQPCPG